MGKNSFYLSFDGSPNPPATDRLLEALERHNIKAAFFMEGRRLENEAECSRRVLAAGHDTGNHSYNHPDFDRISLQECIREVEMTQEIIHKEPGFYPSMLRSPAGKVSEARSSIPSPKLSSISFFGAIACVIGKALTPRLSHSAS